MVGREKGAGGGDEMRWSSGNSNVGTRMAANREHARILGHLLLALFSKLWD